MENQVKIHKEVDKSQQEPLDITEIIFGNKLYFNDITSYQLSNQCVL